MVKNFVKYFVSLSLLVACFVLHANTYDFEQSEPSTFSNQIDFPQNHITSGQLNHSLGNHAAAIEIEVDDENKSEVQSKANSQNFDLTLNFCTPFREAVSGSIDLFFPTYSFRANYSTFWYILFQVFRL